MSFYFLIYNFLEIFSEMDWGLVVKLALPAKVTRGANMVFVIYDRCVTNQFFNILYFSCNLICNL
jgi:hypothetical protein